MSKTSLQKRVREKAAKAAPLVKKAAAIAAAAFASVSAYALKGADLPWRVWVPNTFPQVATKPMAPRHENLWQWFDDLQQGVKPAPRVEVWPRGGAKSSSGEMGCVWSGVKLTRRFVLYVSETQEQADKHVQAVASLFESIGVGRAVNKYGSSKGWKRNQLRTANGFNVAALGLDTAARGIRLDTFRPDLIVFDDIDGRHDSAETIIKKIASITETILPAGSSDCAVLFLQNLIHANSIVSTLVDGTADFLHNREVPCVEPAIKGLVTVQVRGETGKFVYKITAGEPTWAGQDLAICEAQINEWGLHAFLREAQQEVAIVGGFFKADKIKVIPKRELPTLLRKVRAWDKAATEGGGDWSVGVLIGLGDDDRFYVLDVVRGQWSTDDRDAKIRSTAEDDGKDVKVRGPQDPGAAGKSDAEAFVRLLKGYAVVTKPVSGDKEVRADPFSSQCNAGNVFMLEGDWNKTFREELRSFPGAKHDDQVDAATDAFDELNENLSWGQDKTALAEILEIMKNR